MILKASAYAEAFFFAMDKLKIKDWALDDRPREKLMKHGISALSDSEIIAILIGSGNRNETAVELAKNILASMGNNLDELAKKSLKDLQKFNGIGEAKAISILAALELGKRRAAQESKTKKKITSSKEAFNILSPLLADKSHEEFWVVYLNRSNAVVDTLNISKGGITGTVADTKIILKHAVELLSTGIILAHNHPSGNKKPSRSDAELTRKIKEACTLFEIDLLDHIIVCDKESYFSFKDEGIL